jgi:hypothetical protein
MQPPFRVSEVIRSSWELYKKHWGLLLGSFAVMVAVNLLFEAGVSMSGDASVPAFVLNVAGALASILLQLGLMRMTLSLVRGTPARIEDLFGEYRLLLRYLGAYIVYVLVVFVGFLLLVVPGIIFSIKYGLFGYAMLDRNMGIRESLSESARLTQGVKGLMLLTALAFTGLVILSVLPLGLGLVVTIPMIMLMTPIVYEKLSRPVAPEEVPPTADPAAEPETVAPFVPLAG